MTLLNEDVGIGTGTCIGQGELGAGIRYRCHPLLKLAWRVYMSILIGGDMYGVVRFSNPD